MDPRDGASRPLDHRAVYTELDAELAARLLRIQLILRIIWYSKLTAQLLAMKFGMLLRDTSRRRWV